MASQRNEVPAAPAPKTGPHVSTVSMNGAASRYFAAKMTPPAIKQLLFTAATGPVQNDDFSGSWVPMSIMVYNPTSQVIYVATGGANPQATGIAIQPLSISPRLPIPGLHLVIGLNAATNLEDTQYEVQIFRFATPD